MRLLVDLSSVAGGGGAEQAVALLDNLVGERKGGAAHVEYVIRSGSRVASHARSLNLPHVLVADKLSARIYFSLFGARQLIQDHCLDAVYVCFGVGLNVPRGIPQVVSVAYPIICYPDSPFWDFLPRIDWARIKLKAFLRTKLIERRADLILVESALMARRLTAFSGLAGELIRVLPPFSGGTAACMRLVRDTNSRGWCGDGRMKIIFISGTDFHKNLWRLPECARRMFEARNVEVVFRLTVEEPDFVKLCRRAGVRYSPDREGRFFEFLGPKFGEALADEIRASDAVGNISDLESISNNFIEAAAAGKPMLVAERDFAIASVRVPFVSCEPHDPESLMKAVIALMRGEVETAVQTLPLAMEGSIRAKALLAFIKEAVGCGRNSR